MANKQNEYPVDWKEFITLWNSSQTRDEAAAKLKMPPDIASARASSYRGLGVKFIKRMPKENKKKLPIEEMSQLAKDVLIANGQTPIEEPAKTTVRNKLKSQDMKSTVKKALKDIGSPTIKKKKKRS